MHMKPIRAVAHKACRVGVVLAGISFLAGAQTALAQNSPSTPTNVEQAPSEAARRAAASPYRFILLNANAPARKAAPAAPPPAEARRPASTAPVEQAVAVRTLSAPSPVAPPAAAPAQQVPEPAVASLSTKPPEPAPVREVRRELIPVRTDEPKLSSAQLRDGLSGVVRVQFDVNPDGSTGGVKVLASSHRGLNRPTLDAIALWKFAPVDEVLTVQTELVYKTE